MTKQQIQNQKTIHKNAVDAIHAAVNKTDIENHKNDLLKPVNHHLNEIAKLEALEPDSNPNTMIFIFGIIFGLGYYFSRDSICLLLTIGAFGYLIYSALQKDDAEIN
jgi:hypothetical protein